jgi:acylphosphatase
MNEVLHIIVQGRVQGVAFRINAQNQAIKLNICGYVRNLANNDVEIVAQGEDAALTKFVEWCHQGPALARVGAVLVERQQSREVFADFQIR